MPTTKRNPTTLRRAHALRKTMTEAEKRLWFQLRDRRLQGLKFRRQYAIGAFIADFACIEAGVIVELDGSQHVERTSYDEARTAFLQSQGFVVLRFWNNEVLQEMKSVLTLILHTAQERKQDSSLSLQRERASEGRARSLRAPAEAG
jgi:very-short-patch-repair endonuclease